MTQPRKVGGSKPGERRGNAGKGRKKGVPNKATVAVKEALQLAFEGRGGVTALQEWADSDPGEFYKLWVKMLPTEIKAEHAGADGAPLMVVIRKPE